MPKITSVVEKSATPGTNSLIRFLVDRWLPTIERTIRPTTFVGYESHVRCHLLPILGRLELSEIDASAINGAYTQLLANGLSDATVRRVHATIHRAMRDAVRWGLVEQNVAAQADPPKDRGPKSGELRTWNERELRHFLAVAQDHPLHPLWLVYAMTGMRRGEVLGLRWVDTDLTSGRVAVRQTFVEIGGEIRRSTPKTSRSRRVVALDGVTIDVLRRYRATKGDVVDDDLLFSNADGGPLSPGAVTKMFKRLAHQADLPVIRLHDLRHTHATLALRAGVHPKGHLGAPRPFDRRVHLGRLFAFESAPSGCRGRSH